MNEQGSELKVQIVDNDTLWTIKNQLEIPPEPSSCHTALVAITLFNDTCQLLTSSGCLTNDQTHVAYVSQGCQLGRRVWKWARKKNLLTLCLC